MILSTNMPLIHSAILIFNNFIGKDYLLAYRAGKNHPISTVQIRIKKENFWHLVGCELNKELARTLEQKSEVYQKCLQSKDVAKYLNYTHTSQSTTSKCIAFIKIFDFISHAGALRICESNEAFDLFSIGAGNPSGLIGYNSFDSLYYYPKTTYTKSIYEIDPKACQKIVFVVSKKCDEEKYATVEYEQFKDSYQQYLLTKN